ncbi:hypothetical protein SYNPS1DRAFT_19748, partial [Syncephalis pseudoplumigaleata]
CSICKIRKGACVQCCHKFCFTAFHVTCARKARYYMKMKDLLNVDDMRVYCARHQPDEHEAKNGGGGGDDEQADVAKAARAHSHHFLTRAPMVPAYIGHRILQGLQVQMGHRSQFVKHMCKYWALKREMRRGAPLLKRLHLEPWTAYASAQTESDKEKAEKYASLVYLRADLEKIRLLTEMIRRREREKLRLAQLRHRYFEIVAFPLQLLMRQVIDTIQR